MTWNQHMRNHLKHFKSRGLIEIYFLPIFVIRQMTKMGMASKKIFNIT